MFVSVKKGFYVCSACENPLFSSNSKYKHGTPWPAFHSPINQNSLSKRKEDSRAYKVSLNDTLWRLSKWAHFMFNKYVLWSEFWSNFKFNRYHVANVEMVLAMSFLATVQVVRALVSEYLVTPWNLFRKVRWSSSELDWSDIAKQSVFDVAENKSNGEKK